MFDSQYQAPRLMVREAPGRYRAALQDEVLGAAQQLLLDGIRQRRLLNSVYLVKDYLRMRMGALEREVFLVLFLDSQHQFLCDEELFQGTVNYTAVYPREVVKRALHHNACAVVLAHNHPSGLVEPSEQDRKLTQTLKAALALVDIRVLDHVVVGRDAVCSMAERGLI